LVHTREHIGRVGDYLRLRPQVRREEARVNSIIYLVGLVVIVLAILSFVGLA
jgi:hypothetical protein